jgi:DNA-directed RNA polymerase specialized sigma24 family protein
MSTTWPDPEELSSIFQRVREGDRLAPSDFAAAVLDPLVGDLRGWRAGLDEHAYFTAAGEAVWQLLRDPNKYKPELRGLRGYLFMAARDDLINVLKKEAKHHQQRESGDYVELAPDRGNDPSGSLDDLPLPDQPAVAAEIASFDATERAVFELMYAGERATAAYVPILGIEHLSVEEQAREVKRVKERLTKRLQRAWGKT